jgi:hypothetical protein
MPVGGEIRIGVGGMVLGFEPMTIHVTVGCIGKTLDCFLPDPFIIRE